MQAGMGFVVIQQLLRPPHPARGREPDVLLFALGSLTYAAHPEGVVEYQKRLGHPLGPETVSGGSRTWRRGRGRAPGTAARAATPALTTTPGHGPGEGAARAPRPAVPEDPTDRAPARAVSGCPSTSAGIQAVAGCRFRWPPARSSGSWGRTGRARPPCSTASAGQQRPDAGRVRARRGGLDRLPVYRRARLGIGRTFQRVELFPEMTVADHLLVAVRAERGDGALWQDLLNRSKPHAQTSGPPWPRPCRWSGWPGSPTCRWPPSAWFAAGWSSWPGRSHRAAASHGRRTLLRARPG